MPSEKTTFGCGTYLPGFGPDNVPEFDGGGTIDGGGGDEDDPTPPGGIDYDDYPDDGGGGDGPGPSVPGLGDPQVRYWLCTGPPQWQCNSVVQSANVPPPPGAWFTKAQCVANCVDPFGPDTQPGGSPQPPGGRGPTTGPHHGPTAPGQGSVRYWLCTGAPQWKCYSVVQSAGDPPPPGFYSSKEECETGCTGGGPDTAGRGNICRCRIYESQVETSYSHHPPPGHQIIRITLKQRCESIRLEDAGTGTTAETMEAVIDAYTSDPNCNVQSITGEPDGNCTDNGECTGACSDVVIIIFCTNTEVEDATGGDDTGVPPPVDGGGGGTGEGDDGGVVITDTTTGTNAGGGLVDQGDDDPPPPPPQPPPQGPGVPYLIPPPDDGNGDGPTTPGPQGPGPPPMSTPDDSGDGDDAFVPGGGTNVGGGVSTDDGGGGLITDTTTGYNIGGGVVNGDGGGGGSTVFDSGGSSDSADSGATEPGSALISSRGWDKNLLDDQIVGSEDIDLNDPRIVSLILGENPEGIEDPVVAFNVSPLTPTLVPNNSEYTELFNDRIDSNIEYVLSNYLNFGNWDSQRSMGVTPDRVYNSLTPHAQNLLGQIRNYDGTPLNKNQIFSMIGTRILDGTISSISLQYLQTLADSSKKREPILIKRSAHAKVNEVAAFALIDSNKFPLDPAEAYGLEKNIFPNWKTLATDIDKYIEITIGGKIKKYYIKDDDTFIDRSTLSLQEGDYVDVYYGAEKLRIFTKSEIDHAYLIPEKTRQKALQLLGGEGGRTLEVSASILSGIEFDYSLSDPRQDFYMLSCVLSSIDTKPSQAGSFLLKDSTAKYELMDTTTAAGLRNVNTFIKYKANHRVFMLDDSDVMLDYIQSTSALTVKQSDILFDSPKENKTIPLLTRQIPWYIMVYPTNRNSLNIFNTKSKVRGLSTSGIVTRQLKCRTTIVPNFSKEQTNKFVRIETQSRTGTNVLGQVDPQARITKVTSSDTVFQTAYRQDDNLIRAQDYKPSRKKTGLRLLKEIITELDTNYLLGLNGIGKSLTEFDVFSRLTLPQFNVLSRLESFDLVRNAVRNGLIANVKMIPPINRADKRISFYNTQLVQRKVGAPADTFVPIKGTNDESILLPPTTTGPSRQGPITR